MQFYHEEPELKARIKKAGGLKKAAGEIGLRPCTLSNKLNGWSYLFPKERQKLIIVLRKFEAEEEQK